MSLPTAPAGWDLRARTQVQQLRSSAIREVANAAIGTEGVLPFWFGEPDEPTPQDIRDVATREINDGNVFYVQTLGTNALRESLAAYTARLHGRGSVDRIAVTSSGTSALMTAVQAVVGHGDHVVAVTPLWPNLVEIPKVLGARVDTVSLDFKATGWSLDVQKLLDMLTPDTRALLLNSPNNPTGWVISVEDQRTILEHCRKHGIWIISDDVYERYYFEGTSAPTFLDIADEADRVISCNSFSKTWLMTGWRIGWIVAPKATLPEIGKLLEFSTTCTPGFVQAAANHAVNHGEPLIARTVARLKTARDHLQAELSTIPGIELAAAAPGAMYSFFKVTGATDSLAFCRDLISETGLGLAPGIAFGPEGEGYLRWCFASELPRIDDGVARLRTYMERFVR
ncbi:pyridoxal phosphate-dependent aminotransferase [Paeniglutamicibacter psychrophenolicus]|uniref:Aminotransferase n=1 Tax=Paeniglutamicibacter psychrophenolicus TaxID=257454 RepID=A0ABS4WEB0_9MICC|nr:pyridoxal phosphate-dependent aminotransferase [Paeniglutamicibacter psychrophenolicus]MBP2374381.1 aspartate/methionine/tyrosine aminotransferase [Paeniglutamicibacter psychrophenolicus]